MSNQPDHPFEQRDECAKNMPDAEPRGRGALSNETPRFERETRLRVDDGWARSDEELPPLRTEVRLEAARSAINHIRSPDLPFDRTINPYRGCEHGCIYCFARPTHAYLGLSPGLDFETRLIARPNMPEVLERELRKPSYKVGTLSIGTNTDPYQPIEKTYGIMRSCLEVLERFGHPVAIVTKGALVERDIDILARLAARGLTRVGVSVTTLDPNIARRMEPRVPSPARRLLTIRRLSEAGISVRVMASPLVPGLTDHEVEAIYKAAKEAGAEAATSLPLRLPLEVSPLFRNWLAEHFPDRAKRVIGLIRGMHGGKDYDSHWHRRMRGRGAYAQMMSARARLAARRLNLDGKLPPLRCDLFDVPFEAGDQLGLF